MLAVMAKSPSSYSDVMKYSSGTDMAKEIVKTVMKFTRKCGCSTSRPKHWPMKRSLRWTISLNARYAGIFRAPAHFCGAIFTSPKLSIFHPPSIDHDAPLICVGAIHARAHCSAANTEMHLITAGHFLFWNRQTVQWYSSPLNILCKGRPLVTGHSMWKIDG